MIDWELNLSIRLKKFLNHGLTDDEVLEISKLLFSSDNFKDCVGGSGIICAPNRDYYKVCVLIMMRVRNRRPEFVEFTLEDLMDLRMGNSRYEEYTTLSSIEHDLVLVYSSRDSIYNKQSGCLINEVLDLQEDRGGQVWIYFIGSEEQFNKHHPDAYRKVREDNIPLIDIGVKGNFNSSSVTEIY